MDKPLLLLALFLVFGPTQANAQEIPENARAIYEGTDELPDSLAFVSTMTVLDSMNDIDNASPALDLIQRGMGLSSAEARDILDDILVIFKAFSEEHAAYTEEMLCASDGTAPAGTEIYRAFEAIDDANEWLGDKYLLSLKAELGDEKAARFQQWLQSRKHGITYVKVRHEDQYEQAGLSPEVARDNLCSRLARSTSGDAGHEL